MSCGWSNPNGVGAGRDSQSSTARGEGGRQGPRRHVGTRHGHVDTRQARPGLLWPLGLGLSEGSGCGVVAIPAWSLGTGQRDKSWLGALWPLLLQLHHGEARGVLDRGGLRGRCGVCWGGHLTHPRGMLSVPWGRGSLHPRACGLGRDCLRPPLKGHFLPGNSGSEEPSFLGPAVTWDPLATHLCLGHQPAFPWRGVPCNSPESQKSQ